MAPWGGVPGNCVVVGPHAPYPYFDYQGESVWDLLPKSASGQLPKVTFSALKDLKNRSKHPP